MSKILLKNAIETLEQLKMEMYDDMDSSTQAKLDQVIQDLKQHDDLTKSKLLQILGELFQWLPIIRSFLKELSN
ncbi:hypothetical protein [Kingella kingae]|uniref:hypothetical protein n=1 Tax=Kingella kingae TaxID=504 RepID=UPI00255025C5|nr:hypothetical protein [Kingella kingae]MDK4536579.1 hypothetical protein [Kingella kingae]MDK4539000.1 hypothetical protein [Kingella kingae]MDK4547684.1 hypothetical protein [Kingella kingae]MDK4623511.1 hypothetical protein [Kingella kingae]